jgi:hypothetical protein
MSSPNVTEDKAARRARIATDRLREARLELPAIDTDSYAVEGLTQNEVDLRVQIHPVSETIVNIEKSMKVLGVQIRVNNAECVVSVDKLGLASSM